MKIDYSNSLPRENSAWIFKNIPPFLMFLLTYSYDAIVFLLYGDKMQHLKDEKRRRRRLRKQKIDFKKKRIPKLIDLSEEVVGVLCMRTDYSHAKCYAGLLGSCSPKISKEHYLSENILKLFDPIDASQIPFLKGETKKIDPRSLSANVLCETHNEFLSPLDTMAGKLFRFLLSFNNNNWKSMKINGFAFEKWMCKLLMGYISTGRVEHNGRLLTKNDFPQELLEYVYLNKPLPTEWGLYSILRPGDKISLKKRVGFAPMFLGDRLSGLELEFCGLYLILCLAQKKVAFKSSHFDYPNLMYRIREIHGQQLDYMKTLTLIWT